MRTRSVVAFSVAGWLAANFVLVGALPETQQWWERSRWLVDEMLEPEPAPHAFLTNDAPILPVVPLGLPAADRMIADQENEFRGSGVELNVPSEAPSGEGRVPERWVPPQI